MLIRTVCPRCQTSFQVQSELRGKAMRCPLSTCQKVFPIVEAAAEAPPAASPPPAKSPPSAQRGGVGDVVPLLPSSSGAPPAGPSLVPMLPAEPAGPSWRGDGPPVRGGGQKAALPPAPVTQRPQTRGAAAPAAPIPAPAAPPARSAVTDAPQEVPDWIAPPPVRRGQTDEPTGPAADGPNFSFTTAPAPSAPTAPRSTRVAKWIIIPFALLTVLGLGAGGVYVYWLQFKREGFHARKADEMYDNGAFRAAASEYAELAKRYPDSEQLDHYKFRSDLSKLRHAAKEEDDLPKVLKLFTKFLDDKADDPLLKEHAPDVGESLVQATAAFAEEAAKDPKDRAALAITGDAQAVIDRARAINKIKGAKAVDWDKATDAFAKLRQAAELAEERRDVFATLDKLVAAGSYASLLAAKEFIAVKAVRFPGLADEAETKKRIRDIYKKHLDLVKFTEAADAKVVAPGDETEPTLVLYPLVDGTAGVPQRGTPVVLALVRGILYALDRDSGEVRWARRVGIDTTALPTRVPASDGNRERILALSSDTRTLTAWDSDGVFQWDYAMQHPCLGRPVVVENRAYLAALNGDVHEIELVRGKLLGTYSLGQRLTLGGTHEPGSDRVYFPADDGCVYVINVKERKCEAILYSRHPAGSLRGEVILVGPEDDVPGYLILPEASGFDAVELRVFKLPIENKLEGELSLAAQHPVTPPARLDGWTWFRPHHDAERLAMLSDTGRLGLFGIQQRGNRRDQALFPLLPGGELRVASMLGLEDKQAQQRARAEVVQMQGDDLWVLAADRIQRLKLAWDRETGPRLFPVWKPGRTREVGSPLHAAQSFEEEGKNHLIVVTQPPRRPAAWASCLDDELGDLRWRRQLGVVCQGEPIALSAKGQAPLLVLLDQSGSLFSIDPTQYKVKDQQWILDDKLVRLGESLDENADQPPVVLRIDEATILVVACPGDGKELVVRQVEVVAGQRKVTVKERKVPLPSPLAGTPAVVGSRLMLPLASDKLAWLPIDRASELQTRGPDWKAPRAEPEDRGHVVALGGDRFLTTDGVRQLRLWEWPADKADWTALPGKLDLSDRIASAPLLLPNKRLLVADTAGGLHLLGLEDDGTLSRKRKWTLDGPIVAGPFIEKIGDAVRVACVVKDGLTWIDPEKDEAEWTYKTEQGAKIVGRPGVTAEMVVVADQEGRYVGLNLKTGKPLGRGHQLKGSLAPTAGVVAFNDERLMAPLSDGTVLLLGLKRLKR